MIKSEIPARDLFFRMILEFVFKFVMRILLSLAQKMINSPPDKKSGLFPFHFFITYKGRSLGVFRGFQL
jgi:hypothetical protein